MEALSPKSVCLLHWVCCECGQERPQGAQHGLGLCPVGSVHHGIWRPSSAGSSLLLCLCPLSRTLSQQDLWSQGFRHHPGLALCPRPWAGGLCVTKSGKSMAWVPPSAPMFWVFIHFVFVSVENCACSCFVYEFMSYFPLDGAPIPDSKESFGLSLSPQISGRPLCAGYSRVSESEYWDQSFFPSF